MFWSVQYWIIQFPSFKFDLSSSISFPKPKFYSQHFLTESWVRSGTRRFGSGRWHSAWDLEVDNFHQKVFCCIRRVISPWRKFKRCHSTQSKASRGGTRDWLSGSRIGTAPSPGSTPVGVGSEVQQPRMGNCCKSLHPGVECRGFGFRGTAIHHNGGCSVATDLEKAEVSQPLLYFIWMMFIIAWALIWYSSSWISFFDFFCLSCWIALSAFMRWPYSNVRASSF